MPDGIVIIDKPQGWTSMDVCAKLRGILKEKRVGHGGTLDPMATGVLPVFAGRATRAVEFAEKGDKEYIAGLRLGLVTNTQDITIKIHGQKLYELARKGREVERKPRTVTIHALEALGTDAEGDFLLRIRCSKGTYVRTLCHDIGGMLGCGGCMSSLRRTMAAGFPLEDAVTIEEVQEKGAALLRPVDSLFSAHPAWTIRSAGQEKRVRNGSPITVPETAEGLYRVYGPDGTFLCLSRAGGGTLTAVKNFF